MIEVEDEILNKVGDLESRINSMKDNILRMTRLIEHDNKEKENFVKQTDLDINQLEEKVVNYFHEEKQNIKKTIDDKYKECENIIKRLFEESRDNREDLRNKLNFIREQVEVFKIYYYFFKNL